MSAWDEAAWDYVAVMGNGEDSVLEAGPFPTATKALEFAITQLGRRGLDALVMQNKVGEPLTYQLGGDPIKPLIGFSIERYTNETGTDSDWILNGGCKKELVVR